MGGFKPSRADIAGSTIVGSDLAVDTHQFTGSVDITGSLTLNGSSVTGGGGAVANYTNSGNNRVITSVDSDTINGEANLTFDGTSLTSPQVTASVSMKAAILEVSSSAEGALFRVDHSTQVVPTLFVTGSGRVGIGTVAPETPLEIRSTTTQQKWSYDDDHEFTVSVADNGETVLAVSGTTTAGLGASDLVLDVSKGGDIFFRRSGDRLRFGISTGDTFIQTDNQNSDMSFRVHPDGGLGAVGTEIARFDASGAGAFLMSGTISVPGGDAPINFRDTATSIHSPGANHLAITAPTLEVTGALVVTSSAQGALLKVDHDDLANILFVTGSGRVGIGTDSALANLHVSSSDTGNLFRIDHNDNTDNPIFVVTGSGRLGIGTATPSAVLDVDPDNAAGSNTVRFKGSAQASLFNYTAGEHTYLRGGKTTSTIFIADARTSNGSSNQKAIIGNVASTTAKLHVSSSDTPIVMNVTSNSGSILTALENQRVGVGTNAPVQTLSVSGSAAFSGAFGSTAIETLTANAIMSANTGLSIIDASSSLAVNNTLTMAIENGSFVGQEKKIRGIVISGSTGQLSTGIFITGSNIDAVKTNPLGLITLTSSVTGGPAFQRAGCVLVWGGTKWLPVGNYNFDINGTRTIFG